MGKMINDAMIPDSNCAIKVVEFENNPHLCIFASNDILMGDELRYDYGVADLPWRKITQVLTVRLI